VRQPFLERQTELCQQASEAVAQLATSDVLDDWQKARGQFWTLYYGPLAMVEDVATSPENRVEAMMVHFGNLLLSADRAKPDLPLPSQFGARALCVAHACRDLLVSRWNYGILWYFSQEQDRTAQTEEERQFCEKPPTVGPGHN